MRWSRRPWRQACGCSAGGWPRTSIPSWWPVTGRSPLALTRRPRSSTEGSRSSTCPLGRQRWSGPRRSRPPAAVLKRSASSCPTRRWATERSPTRPIRAHGSNRTHRLRQWSAMSPELWQVALTAVPEGSGQLVLREIEDRDLGVLFEHSSDRDAIRMAAFTSPEFDDGTSFERRWARLRSDSSTTNRVIEIDGRVVGHIASFDLEGRREVTYWIGREDWGRGIATRALQEFLQLEATRPLYAGAASDNAASIRVLTKCGFVIVGEGRGFAYGRNEETDEVVLRLDA